MLPIAHFAVLAQPPFDWSLHPPWADDDVVLDEMFCDRCEEHTGRIDSGGWAICVECATGWWVGP